MTVQVAFQRSDGCLVHRLICFLTRSEFAHCEVVINGKGYTPKRDHDELYSRNPSEYESAQWELVTVPLSTVRALQYVHDNRYTTYDFPSLMAYLIPLFRDHVVDQNCAEFVVNLASFCGSARFHNLDASRFSPGLIYSVLSR